MKEAGFVLIVSLIITVLMSCLVGLAFLHVNQQWNLAADVESQLRSQVLAENGIEYAKHLLPYLQTDELLVGADGEPCLTLEPEWRNPTPLEVAQKYNPDEWLGECDDGLFVLPGNAFGHGLESACFVRFSNNPEEEPFEDFDHVLIARSMGIVPERISSILVPELINHVTVLEVSLRQEVLFDLPSPLVIFGDGGDFYFEGVDFLVDGGSECAISVLGLAGSSAWSDLQDALLAGQLASLQSGGGHGPIRDASAHYASRYYSRLFEVSFWEHFLEHLPEFAEPFSSSCQESGLYYLLEGGVLEDTSGGLLVVQGDLELVGNAHFSGLLLHLGNGVLSLRDDAAVTGGVWLSNLDLSGDELGSHNVSLALAGSSRISYDSGLIQAALQNLPATQLGWRMIFPEMGSE
ncbi:MAG: hypothetical protein ACWGQW_16815 [bacterium]